MKINETYSILNEHLVELQKRMKKIEEQLQESSEKGYHDNDEADYFSGTESTSDNWKLTVPPMLCLTLLE